jgi:general secretion pathway protein F
MGAFEYTAVDGSGRERKGVLEGDTPRHVRQMLREQKLIPLAVSEVAQKQKVAARRSFRRPGMSPADLSLVTRQLATLVRSGMPLEEALRAVAEQNEKPKLKSVILGVRARVMEGHALAEGLADFPQAFPELYRATVAAGEQSGHLDEVLERLADYTESRQQLQTRIRNAMIYPAVLVSMSLGIIGLMMVYVVPKVVGVFENTGEELPWLTRTLIVISDFMRDYWWALAGLIVIAAFAWRRALRQEGVRRRYHRFLLRMPLVGRVTRGLNTARFTRTFSILAGSGVPVLDALKIAGQVVQILPMRDAVEDAALRVREGAAIARSLGSSKVFPPMTIHLIGSGEASGQLEQMLERAASNQEREMDGLITTTLGILEPMLIVVMGLLVFLIVIAILLPIFQLNQLVA